MEKDNKYTNELEKLKGRIRDIRKQRGFRSADSFAEALGVSLKTVQGWENLDNGRWPDLVMMLKVCDLTGYDLDYYTGRMEEPTHEIKYIHEKTGLSVEAVAKLISSKDAVMDSPLSDIIVSRNADRLLRVISLAADEDEIDWLNLNRLPSGLLSAYADSPYDFSSDVGSDVAAFLLSQELTNIVGEIRSKRKTEKEADTSENRIRSVYDVYGAKMSREMMLEHLDDAYIDIYNSLKMIEHTAEETERLQTLMDRIQALRTKIRNASFAEWKRGDIEKEYKDIYGEEE